MTSHGAHDSATRSKSLAETSGYTPSVYSLGEAMRTASEMSGGEAATMTVSELESLALSHRASNNLDIVVKRSKHNRNVLKRVRNALGWVFIAYDGLKRTTHALRTGGFDDGRH